MKIRYNSIRKTNKGKKYWTKRFDMRFKQTLLGISLFCVVVAGVGAMSTYHTKKYNSIMQEFNTFKESRLSKKITVDLGLINPQNVFKTPVVKAEGLPVEQTINKETVEQTIRRIAKEENFQWPDYLVRLAKCESSLNPKAVNTQGNKPKQSRDRGLFQINDYYHKHVSDAQAFDVEFSTKYTIKLINEGKQGYWVCDKKI